MRAETGGSGLEAAQAVKGPFQPPVLIGSRSDKVFRRVVHYADRWCPLLRPDYDAARGLQMLRQAAAEAGRRFEDLHLLALLPAATIDAVKQAADLGFQQICFVVPSAERGQALSVIDGFVALAEKLR